MERKIAIITGASRGIGKSASLFLAGNGYYTILIARNEKKLIELSDRINGEFSGAKYYVLDVSDKIAVVQTMNDIIKEFKTIDLLFNCAGVLNFGILETPYDEIEQMIKINLLGTIFVTNVIAEHMKKQRKGYIINMSSMSGKRAMPIAGIYAASKFGVTGYNEALFNELTQYGVKVTAICPALIATDMTDTFHDRVPPEKMINMDNIIKTLEYLLSLDSSAVIKEILISGTY